RTRRKGRRSSARRTSTSIRSGTRTASSSSAARSRRRDPSVPVPMQPPDFAEVDPVRGGEHEARRDADERLRGGPVIVPVRAGEREREQRRDPDRDDVEAPMHAYAEREAYDADRDDEPQHQRVEMR